MKWISVKDRLPEKSGNYLAFDKPAYGGGDLCHLYYSIEYNEWLSFTDQNDFSSDIKEGLVPYNITHWMPLPEPPKE